MNGFANLLNCAGTWEGKYRLQPSPEDSVSESASRLIVTPVLRDTFIRLDQTWSWNNDPQSGSLLIGCARDSNAVSIHWIDTWHNGTNVMPLTGEFDPTGLLIARGHFAVQGSPDWGWRIELQVKDAGLSMNMFCVNPNTDKDEGWVWSEYRRA